MKQRKRFIPFWKIAAGELMSRKIDYFLSNLRHVIQISTKVLNKTPPPATSGWDVDSISVTYKYPTLHGALATQLLWKTSPHTLLFSSTALKLSGGFYQSSMASVEDIRNAQRAKGPATILAIGTATPDNCVYQSDYADYYFRVTKSDHMTDLKKKFNRICKYIYSCMHQLEHPLHTYMYNYDNALRFPCKNCQVFFKLPIYCFSVK